MSEERLEVRPAAHQDVTRYDFSEGKEVALHLGGLEQLRAFISSVRAGTPVFATGEAGKRAVSIGIAAELSAEQGEIINVEDLPGYY